MLNEELYQEETEEYEEIEEIEEGEGLEDDEDYNKSCWCFGDMDSAGDEDFEEYCENCGLFDECFFKTYGMLYSEWLRTEKKAEEKALKEEKIEGFLEGLCEVKPHVPFNFSKPRKIVKIGKLSFGVTIPKILNEVYPRGSEVLVFWSEDSKLLLFFGENSFVAEDNKERLKILFNKGYATFRNVGFIGKLNVLVIPRQWTQYFNTNLKVNPRFDSSCCTLFLKSNLTNIELEKLEKEKQAKSYVIYSTVSKVSGNQSYRDSSEYKQNERFKRGL